MESTSTEQKPATEQKPVEEVKADEPVMIDFEDMIRPYDPQTKTGGEFEIKGLKVAYNVYESEKFNLKNRPPVIAVHGGPGFTCNYMMPIKKVASLGYPVIMYDQAGCGASTSVTDVAKNAPWLLTIEYYIEELKQLVEHLGLKRFYLYGSSWGTCVAQEFAVLQPEGLCGILLDGALSDS